MKDKYVVWCKQREQYYKKADLKIKNCETINETINEIKKIFNINE